ncbi:transmembrane protein [Legionella santicrucis]|uniref:Transmembrane protein n=1 Tax=Legionella santicrucis TaxID=45074 RepID=A0A0W0ZEH3_9GAMM|nr:hypothetical protein [Legionella santicrucis]KTD67541.1 transmembrane protein [Legionella santicrucis]
MIQKITKFIFGIQLLLLISLGYAGSPLWSFTPLTPTNLTLASTNNGIVAYRVTNNSNKHTFPLVLQPMRGVKQIVVPGICSDVFTLPPHQSCILALQILGSEISGNINGGPIVCNHANPLQCYRPDASSVLHVTTASPQKFSVSGNVSNLSTVGLTLQLNGGEFLAVAPGNPAPFTFTTGITYGGSYNVTVRTQPAGLTCTVTANGSGTNVTADVTNVAVNCVPRTYKVGGSISGNTTTQPITLRLTYNATNTNDLVVPANANRFVFPTALSTNDTYAVTVLTPPPGETCTVSNGTGTIANNNVTNISVVCSATTFTVSAAVTGLTAGSFQLQNNNDASVTANANTTYQLSAAVANGSQYNVIVVTQPAGQTCTAINSSGTVNGTNVTVNVTCSANANTFTIGGTITGLTTSGLQLQNNSTDTISPAANATTFTFNTPVVAGGTYNVTIKAFPDGLLCQVVNGSGTATANVTNVEVHCAYLAYIGNEDPSNNTQPVSICLADSTTSELVRCGSAMASSPPFDHPEAIAFNPEGTRAYVSDTLGSPRAVYLCDVDQTTRLLTNCRNAVNDGHIFAAPEILEFNSAGTIAYVPNETSGGVINLCDVNPDTGVLSNCARNANASFTQFLYPEKVKVIGTHAFVADYSGIIWLCNIGADNTFTSCVQAVSGLHNTSDVNFHGSPTTYAYIVENSPSQEGVLICNVDLSTGHFSGCKNAINGSTALLDEPEGIVFDADGSHAYISNEEGTRIALCVVDSVSGMLSNCVDATNPPFTFHHPTRITLQPTLP